MLAVRVVSVSKITENLGNRVIIWCGLGGAILFRNFNLGWIMSSLRGGLCHHYMKDYVVVGFLSIRGSRYHHQKLVTLGANSRAGGLALLCRV